MRTVKKSLIKPENTATPQVGSRERRSPAGRVLPKRAAESTPVRTLEVKVIAIGNSRGVRLPRGLLARYAIGDAVLLEEREEGLLLRGKGDQRLSWEDTYAEMARAQRLGKRIDRLDAPIAAQLRQLITEMYGG